MPKGLTHECKNDWFCYQLCTLVNNGLELAIASTCDYFLCFFLARITDVSMALQDQAYSEDECDGR